MTYSFDEQATNDRFISGHTIFQRSFAIDSSHINVGQDSYILDLSAQGALNIVKFELAFNALPSPSAVYLLGAYKTIINSWPEQNQIAIAWVDHLSSWQVVIGAPTEGIKNAIDNYLPILTVWYTKQ